MNDHAAAWICPRDEVHRGDLLGAANVACARHGRLVSEVLDEHDGAERAFDAARRTGMLILPEMNTLLSEEHTVLGMLQRARDEGWRLLALDVGADSDGASSKQLARLVERINGGKVPDPDRPVPPAAQRRPVGGESSPDGFGR